jgi:hypothetical protein
MKWTIENMKRMSDSGLVTEVAYRVVAKESGLIADKTGKVTLTGNPDAEGFVPFNELAQAMVISWVKSSVDFEAIETEVQAILENKKAKKAAQTTKTGLPWGNKNIMGSSL